MAKATAITTTVSELPGSRVSIAAQVAPAEVARAVEAAARALGRNLKLAGFRKGKIPAAVIIQRLGREAVLDEAVRERIGRWYVQALAEAGVAAVGDPRIELDDLPAEGEPLRFSLEIGVVPTAKLGTWRGLEVQRREPLASEDVVERQIEEARERLARLESVDRAAAVGDFVVVDYAGSIDGVPIEGGEARGALIEIGAGRLVPGFEDGLVGASGGEEREIAVRFPDDYPAHELAGRGVVFAVSVSEVREKLLPELDDDFATDAAGFATLDEMREDARTRLLEADTRAVEREFREAALDAAVEKATIDVPEELIDARARETWERTLHSLEHRGMSKEAFLQISGKSEEEVIAEAHPDAEQSLRREAVIAAIVKDAAIEPTDADLIAALEEGMPAEDAGGKRDDPAELLERLRKADRLDDLRADVAADQALSAIVAAAKPVAAAPEQVASTAA
jgi:trigger factor